MSSLFYIIKLLFIPTVLKDWLMLHMLGPVTKKDAEPPFERFWKSFKSGQIHKEDADWFDNDFLVRELFLCDS